MKKTTLEQILPLLSTKLRCSIKNGKSFYREMIYMIGITLKKEGKVKICNFGTFYLHHKKSRPGRNPNTREPYIISSRNIIKFIPSTILKKKIKGND